MLWPCGLPWNGIRNEARPLPFYSRKCRACEMNYINCDDWENIYTLSYYHHQIGSIHCLGLGHETIVCAVCLSIFVRHIIVFVLLFYKTSTSCNHNLIIYRETNVSLCIGFLLCQQHEQKLYIYVYIYIYECLQIGNISLRLKRIIMVVPLGIIDSHDVPIILTGLSV